MLLVVYVIRPANAVESEWQLIDTKSLIKAESNPVRTSSLELRGQHYWLNGIKIKQLYRYSPALAKTALAKQDSRIQLPVNGSLRTFTAKKNHLLPESLQRKYPAIQTFDLYNQQQKLAGKLEKTPSGMHASYLVEGQKWMLEPDVNTDVYLSYLVSEQQNEAFSEVTPRLQKTINSLQSQRALKPQNSVIHQYRLAMATTGEYSAKFSNDVEAVLSSTATLIQRINLVFQSDLAIEFVMAENSDQIIFTDATTDPFNNNTDDIDKAATVINERIGSQNFDLGHVLGTTGGGYASVGVTCVAGAKAEGYTGYSVVNNDYFYIDLVAHEIGHQVGGTHSFNGTSGFCSGNRSFDTAWEPGSGSTIMSYAGLCNSEDLQANVDDYFHIGTILQYRQELTSGRSGNCGTLVNLTSEQLVADAGANYTIPAQTPFMLTALQTENNPEGVTYNWEQYFEYINFTEHDPTPSPSASATEMAEDDGTRPLFRSFKPVTDPVRYLPALDLVLRGQGITRKGETYPTTSRLLRFGLSVRDNMGRIATDQAKITTTTEAGPFITILPDNNTLWHDQSEYSLEWDVANTDAAPVNCSAIDVYLSKTADASFDTLLASNIPNTGSAKLSSLPSAQTSNARLMLKCSDNIFYAVTPEFDIDVQSNRSPIAVDDELSLNENSSATEIDVLANDSDPDENDSLRIVAVTYEGQGTVTFTDSVISYTPATGFTGTETVTYQIEDDSGDVASAVLTIQVEKIPVVLPTPSGQNSGNGGGSAGGVTLLTLLCCWLVRRLYVANN
ncbi:reprolysin-like metallopeptidase [Neptunicella marina]|uniref:reprolysin-like metallopeptidase n=1 Tax=Neptunicella marina TaxID=2125989 RepID=UPI00164724AF|nr:zinc-dependent metalloprotease family protein [Neptunicella marina]